MDEGSVNWSFSNSEFQTWMDCRRRWYISYYLQRGPKKIDDPITGALAIGTRVHVALERWYQFDEDPIEVLDWLYGKTIHDLLVRERSYGFVDRELRRKVQSERELMHAMVEGYVEWVAETGADEGLQFAGAEVTVEVASGVPGVALRGRLDKRVHRLADGARLFEDYKPQPLTEPVLTPSGWRLLGELQENDEVIGHDGSIQRVLAVFDRGEDDVYDIHLNDGTMMRSTADHPWFARDTRYGKWKVVEARHLKTIRHRIANFSPIVDQEDNEDLPLPPYTLGTWIANGDRHGRGVSDGVPETVAHVAEQIKRELAVTQRDDRQDLYFVKFDRIHRQALDDLNLLGLHSQDRFIPPTYVYNVSYQQRLALLHGLMDSDGTLTTSHSSVYHTTSKQLACDVADLARSLGMWAKIDDGRPSHVGSRKNGYFTGTTYYGVAIRSTVNPFLHVHHAERWRVRKETVQKNKGGGRGKHGGRGVDRVVRAVRWSGRENVRCIKITGDSSLFVTRDWAITHNTAGNLTDGPKLLPIDEQTKFYMLLERLDAIQRKGAEPSEPTVGGLYTMLRKVKRTSTAKPPFFQRVEVQHNRRALEAMFTRTQRRIQEILETRRALDAGGDHQWWVYPRPSRDCSWKCPFLMVCPMMDDSPPETWQAMLNNEFVHRDPYERYGDDRESRHVSP